MAEATRSKVNTDRWEEAFARLSSSMSSKIDELLHRMNQLETAHTPPRAPSPAIGAPTASASHRMKLEVPRFDGTDPEGWIFKVTQFFEYHSTPDHERLTIASFYIEGSALAWFQWMHRSGQLSSWPAFFHAIHARFSSSTYKDPIGLLCKLTQQSTVSAYLSEFEALANRVIGLPAPFVLSYFISGLNPAIQREVQVMQPHSLVQAISFVRLHEEKMLDGRRPSVKGAPHLSYGPPPRSTPPILPKPSESLLLPPPAKSSNTIPFKQLSPTKLAMRREKGLCYNCDEKYTRGHKYTSSLFLFVIEDDNYLPDAEPPLESPPSSPLTSQEVFPAQISLHALSGQRAPETLRVTGIIGQHLVRILIDGGSTHNFLQQELVTKMKLKPQPTSTL